MAYLPEVVMITKGQIWLPLKSNKNMKINEARLYL